MDEGGGWADQLDDELETAGRNFLSAYRDMSDVHVLRHHWRVFQDLFIMRQTAGAGLPRPSWKPSYRHIAVGWSKEIQWVGRVIDELEQRKRIV